MKKYTVKTKDGSVIANNVKAQSAEAAITAVRKMYPKRLANTDLVAVEQ